MNFPAQTVQEVIKLLYGLLKSRLDRYLMYVNHCIENFVMKRYEIDPFLLF